MQKRTPRNAPRTTLQEDSDAGTQRPCDFKKCTAGGIYRAPLSPERLRTYLWFCLDHVREYHKAWNYCAGKSDTEIEALIREDIVGWRPTWPLGQLGSSVAQMRFNQLRDEFGLSEDNDKSKRNNNSKRRKGRRNSQKLQSAVDEALDILDLSTPVTAVAAKAKYITLVKQHHPDANGGDKAAEERLKLINQAYETLKETLTA